MPSGLAIGEGLAKGFDSASKNFLSSMQAVRQMRMEKEKHDLDFKVADLKMKQLGLELDPEVHAQKKELLKQQINAAKALDTWRLAKATEVHNKKKSELQDFQKSLDFINTISQRDPAIAARMGIDAKGGMKLSPQGAQKEIKPEIYNMMQKQAKDIAKSKTKNKGFFGPTPTPEEVNTELQGLISQYRGAPGAVEQPSTPEATGGAGEEDGDMYDDDIESLIEENMQHYGKSREEIIDALKKNGAIQ